MCIRDSRFAEDLLRRLRDLIIVAAVPEALSSGLVDVAGDQAERLTSQATAMGAGELTRAAEAVSYTHLDVYKRQTPNRPLPTQLGLTASTSPGVPWARRWLEHPSRDLRFRPESDPRDTRTKGPLFFELKWQAGLQVAPTRPPVDHLHATTGRQRQRADTLFAALPSPAQE